MILALLVLLGGGFNRADWRMWIDADHDCLNTREEVLVRESTVPVEFDVRGCLVLSGRWLDPYSGQVFTDPRKLDIDHVVPLANADRSGGHKWSAGKKRDYANYLGYPWHLRAVSAGLNRQKGDKGPDRWMPPNPAIRCEYGRAWEHVKKQWGLTMTHEERVAVIVAERACKE